MELHLYENTGNNWIFVANYSLVFILSQKFIHEFLRAPWYKSIYIQINGLRTGTLTIRGTPLEGTTLLYDPIPAVIYVIKNPSII